ncbi:hypothetical protein M422DRAFT_783184 [Sphaerobolus stellatus SS14]|uniref:P-type ATPase N-terminal domain-containing protein n=1 Tax=Sphaerobolus stellatus (strain SS14) TaxID=990650 RepID=A0A0C9V7I0_SPHS4|nr:hypothetical protein M422DRAFT_783184 [Sphaerobolus stellatus SS14]
MAPPQAQQPQPGVKRIFPRYDYDLNDGCDDEQRACKWPTTFTASSPHRISPPPRNTTRLSPYFRHDTAMTTPNPNGGYNAHKEDILGAELVPDSVFASNCIQGDAQHSGLPLSKNAAPPPQAMAFRKAGTLMTLSSHYQRTKAQRRSPQKEEEKTGERVLALNDEQVNLAEAYCSSYVSTSKYNIATFLPKFLTEQFSKYAKVFFLFTTCIQQIPGASPTNRYTTILPLGLILLASAFKEFQEDLKRYQYHKELTDAVQRVLSRTGTSTFIEIPSASATLSASNPTTLSPPASSSPPLSPKRNESQHQTSLHTYLHPNRPHLVQSLAGQLRCEQPNNSLYTFEGTLELRNPNSGGAKAIPLGPDQMLLRGGQLRNTPWCYGLVVYTGHETKLMRNATSAPIKRTAGERQVNVQIDLLIIILLALSIGSSIGAAIRLWFFASDQWYLSIGDDMSSKAITFLLVRFSRHILRTMNRTTIISSVRFTEPQSNRMNWFM